MLEASYGRQSPDQHGGIATFRPERSNSSVSPCRQSPDQHGGIATILRILPIVVGLTRLVGRALISTEGLRRREMGVHLAERAIGVGRALISTEGLRRNHPSRPPPPPAGRSAEP